MKTSRRDWLRSFASRPPSTETATGFSLERFYAERKATGADRTPPPKRAPRQPDAAKEQSDD